MRCQGRLLVVMLQKYPFACRKRAISGFVPDQMCLFVAVHPPPLFLNFFLRNNLFFVKNNPRGINFEPNHLHCFSRTRLPKTSLNKTKNNCQDESGASEELTL